MNPPKPQAGLLGKLVGVIAAGILLVLGFMFSLVLLVILVAGGLAVGAWFFWKTRHLRKAMREAAATHVPAQDGTVIEGEAIVVEDYRASHTAALPDDRARSGPA